MVIIMENKSFLTEKGNIEYWHNDLVEGRLTLVFLPGLTADHHLFDKQIEYFKSTYNVLIWDAPGHALSRPFSLDISLMDQAEWLHDILEKENIKKPVLIGQSMGGYVSQCYMEKYSGSAYGFVSIDSAPLQRKYVTSAEIWLLKRTGPIYRSYPWKRLKKDGANGCSETEYGRSLMYSFINSYSKEEYCELAHQGYRMLAEAYEADLPYKISCPVMLICGKNDRAGSTKRYNKKWAEIENLKLIWIKNAGHNSNTDQPNEVNRWIERFLQDIGT